MKALQLTLALIGILFFFINSNAATCTALANGNWSNPATWSCGAQPGCGDLIIIPAGIIVLVDVHVNLDESSMPACSTAVHIDVFGTLQYQTGKKIYLSCGSTVEIMVGGKMLKGRGWGESNALYICNNQEWHSDEGSVNGYRIFGIVPLAVTLLNFDVAIENNNFLFNWDVRSESNNDKFQFFSSFDGVNWSIINEEPSIGDHTTIYSYTSRAEIVQTEENLVYIQLQQKDKDGVSTILDTKYIELNTLKTSAFPNPLNGTGNVNVRVPKSNSDATLKVYNSFGGIIFEERITASSSTQIIPIDLSGTNSGIYFIEISDGTNVQTHKVLK